MEKQAALTANQVRIPPYAQKQNAYVKRKIKRKNAFKIRPLGNRIRRQPGCGSPVRFPGRNQTVGHGPTFDRCVVGYGENEQQARANAEAVLYGRFGHNGYHLGDLIPTI